MLEQAGPIQLHCQLSAPLRIAIRGERTESSWNTDNDTLASQLFGDVDLVAGRVFDEVDVGDGITDFDKGRASRVEEGGLGAEGARHGGREAAGGEHFATVCSESELGG